MYNKFVVIITAENKESYISKTISSCLSQKFCPNIEIIVAYSKLSNEHILKKKFKEKKNVIFLKTLIKKKYPTQDQIYKIYRASKDINDNRWILLLDGDDEFKLEKIYTLNEYNLEKNLIYLNNHELIFKNISLIKKRKKYKEFNIYKFLFNDWPDKINTSSLIINNHLLKKFFKNTNPYQWKYLAIDVQLVIYYHYKNKLKFLNSILTSKRESVNNLDKTYSNYMKKIYWDRRFEQHKLTRMFSNKKNYLDYLLTFIMKNLLKI